MKKIILLLTLLSGNAFAYDRYEQYRSEDQFRQNSEMRRSNQINDLHSIEWLGKSY